MTAQCRVVVTLTADRFDSDVLHRLTVRLRSEIKFKNMFGSLKIHFKFSCNLFVLRFCIIFICIYNVIAWTVRIDIMRYIYIKYYNNHSLNLKY